MVINNIITILLPVLVVLGANIREVLLHALNQVYVTGQINFGDGKCHHLVHQHENICSGLRYHAHVENVNRVVERKTGISQNTDSAYHRDCF